MLVALLTSATFGTVPTRVFSSHRKAGRTYVSRSSMAARFAERTRRSFANQPWRQPEVGGVRARDRRSEEVEWLPRSGQRPPLGPRAPRPGSAATRPLGAVN